MSHTKESPLHSEEETPLFIQASLKIWPFEVLYGIHAHNYMEDLDSSFPCRVLDFFSKIFLFPFPCASGSHGKQTFRLLRHSASSLVIHNLCAPHVTLPPANKWLCGAVWSWKPLVPQCQSHFPLQHRSLVPGQKDTWCLDGKASAQLSIAMSSCHVMAWALACTWVLIPELPENLLSRLIILFLRGLGFCVADCSPVSL